MDCDVKNCNENATHEQILEYEIKMSKVLEEKRNLCCTHWDLISESDVTCTEFKKL